MKNNRIALLVYSLALIIISIAITIGAVRYFTAASIDSGTSDLQDLKQLSVEDVAKSPVADRDTLIEIFSYNCHYCALNEDNIAEMATRLPAGNKLLQLHLSSPGATFSRTDNLFATLTVMGIEKQYRKKIYSAVNDERIDLGTPAVRDMWLQKNDIDVATFHKVSASEETRTLMDYMAKISEFYQVRATPTFIVNKKWIALQDREYPDFSDHILSLFEKDRPLEK